MVLRLSKAHHRVLRATHSGDRSETSGVRHTYRICARDLEAVREVVEGVDARAHGVLGPRHLREQARAAVHAQLADVHVRLRRTHRTTLPRKR